MKLIKKFFKDHRGQSLVEFALILPILVFLLFAIMEGGLIFAGYLELENAARDGARYAAIHSDVDTEAEIRPWVTGRFSLLKAEKLEITQFERKETNDKKDKWVELSLKYPMPITTPLISKLTGNPVDLTTKMAMRVE